MVRVRQALLRSGNRFLALFKLTLQFGELVGVVTELLTQPVHLRFLIFNHLIFGLQVFRVSLRCQGCLPSLHVSASVKGYKNQKQGRCRPNKSGRDERRFGALQISWALR
jgi:hypothetical protein